MFASRNESQTKQPEGRCPGGDSTPDRKTASELNPVWQSLAMRTGVLQPKLTIGQADDPYEREADCVADQVMRMPAPQSDSHGLSITSITSYHAQRKCAECEEDEEEGKLQRKENGSAAKAPATAPPIVQQTLNSPGQPLDAGVRGFLEPRLGYDFSNVRVHTGVKAAKSTQSVNAQAYTVGHAIVFGAGQYQPLKPEGQRLLAHELAHVVQQGSGSFTNAPAVQRQTPPAPASAPAPAMGELTEAMLNQIASTLHEAIADINTDEEAIYSALSGRTQEQADAIARVYQEMYSVDLLSELQSKLSESEMMHLAIYNPPAAFESDSVDPTTADADLIARQLNIAMDRGGTDEESVHAALTGRTQDELKNIKDAYNRLTKSELEADISDKMSGSERDRALVLLNQGVLNPEDEAYFAMKGLGADKETLLQVLETVKGDRAKVMDLIDKFHKLYGNLLEWVNKELSGPDLNEAMEALLGATDTTRCSEFTTRGCFGSYFSGGGDGSERSYKGQYRFGFQQTFRCGEGCVESTLQSRQRAERRESRSLAASARRHRPNPHRYTFI